MKYSIAFILFFTIFLTACEDQHNENNPGTFCLGDTLQLTMKQTKEETLSGVTLTFDSVLTDSRCPTMVVCVWEGDASVQLLLDRETGKDTVILHTHGSAGMPSSDTVHGYCFHLIDLSPYPVYAEPIPQSEYVVKLIAEKQ